MSNDLIRDSAGIASDARRIKDHGTMTAPGFLRLNRHVWSSNRFGRFRWRNWAGRWDGLSRWSGFPVHLLVALRRAAQADRNRLQ